jgi:hypothetical protein
MPAALADTSRQIHGNRFKIMNILTMHIATMHIATMHISLDTMPAARRN